MSKKILEGYKVVRGVPDVMHYVSAVATPLNTRNCSFIHDTYYDLNEWTKRKPGFGALAVFKTLEDAKEFAYHESKGVNSRHTLKIFKCYYRSSKLAFLSTWCTKDWDGTGEPIKKSRALLGLPKGSAMASSVMITGECLYKETGKREI